MRKEVKRKADYKLEYLKDVVTQREIAWERFLKNCEQDPTRMNQEALVGLIDQLNEAEMELFVEKSRLRMIEIMKLNKDKL